MVLDRPLRLLRPLSRAGSLELFPSTDISPTGAGPLAKPIALAPGAMLLPGWAAPEASRLMDAVEQVTAVAPFRTMQRPGGAAMSVGMTNCGSWGWLSDAQRYRYSNVDPVSGKPWPAMPSWLAEQASAAAAAAGHPGFAPDACLMNRYLPGNKLSLHRDEDEADLGAPIVSVSLGLPAVFLWGGLQRSDPVQRVRLAHGDVVVWGGPARMSYHGVNPLKDGDHPLLGAQRWNLTFRMARARYESVSPAADGRAQVVGAGDKPCRVRQQLDLKRR